MSNTANPPSFVQVPREQFEAMQAELQSLSALLRGMVSPAVASPLAGISIGDAIKKLIASKTNGNYRPVYVKSLGYYLRRFAAGREADDLTMFKTDVVEKWLLKFRSAYARQTWLNRISSLFSFTVRQEWLTKNPCDRIDRVRVDAKNPTVLSFMQSRLLLYHCPTACRAWLVMAMFAGIRPDGELMKVDWKDVNLETKTVAINFPKVRKYRRIVPLEPVAVELLRPIHGEKGLVAPSFSTLRRFKRSMCKPLGVSRWPQDVLRHTAASYLLALHGDAGKVATRLGNSVSILLSHYHNPVAAAECAAFWSSFGIEFKGPRPHGYKLTEADVLQIRRDAAAGTSNYALAEKFGVRSSTISYVVNRITWKHLPAAQGINHNTTTAGRDGR
jgi:integrase